MPHTSKRIDRATHALTAYEHDAFPGTPSLLQRDHFYTEALLTALICDLEHYANHHGIHFSGVVSTGRAINAEEVSQDAPFKVGDQACLTRQDDRCGTVIGWQTTGPDAETCYLIAVPGIPYIYAEPAAHLAPAPAFPPTETILGTVRHADQAEQLYINITTKLPDAPEPTRRALELDRQRLLAALSSWSRIPATRLHNELTPRPTSTRHRPPDPQPAAADFPAEIEEALHVTPPATHTCDQQPSSAPGASPTT
ncbi:hypothetical protein LUW76_25090 [Actinomadura madurae]|uniref:hypothetical protein n=1 Tax=Actinomadura madurae TaxID=1993 RepID=UPI0020263C77|nr:hypothetical protein [Actinomadura madurae]URM97363.1 hypothetical protein LUW76_25090 [Actinomadura madurae]URN07628.1 hypothetical protein LUW74_32585 [Actinomadura madurae]